MYYSVLQFYGLVACYTIAYEFSNGHYYYMDLFCFIPLSIFLSNNGPNDSLNGNFPHASLIKLDVIIGIVGHLLIGGIGVWSIWALSVRYPESLLIYHSTPKLEIVPDLNIFA